MKTIKQNLHTHTCLDHGKDTVDELCQTAIAKGFTVLGFSGHGYNRPIASTSMSRSNQEKYLEQVHKAQKKYQGQLEIYCGVEQDSMMRVNPKDFDYIIGSVHWIKAAGNIWEIDKSPELFAKMRDEAFDGSIEKLVRRYYDDVKEMMDWPEVDIVGHIDLISKFNENEEFFPWDAEWYLDAAKSAIDKGIENGLVFEMNTGAIARKNRLTPYPHPLLLKYMADHDAKLCINTDCHDRQFLDLEIQECIDKAKKAGFKTLYKMSPSGLVPEPIENFTGLKDEISRPAIHTVMQEPQRAVRFSVK